MKPVLEYIKGGHIDPIFFITHVASLAEAPKAYRIFCDKQDDRIEVVLKP